ncbi:MAG: NADH-quinone oxidoreductase subunit J [Acidimicrobiia bacterium]|nr:NADH-quinone oxidoreductase subunit J [Acidimicrobiia bacterium]
MEAVVFWIFATISVAGALIMVWSRSTVHSALGLMATLFSVAVLYILNEGHFLAAAQVLVYAGAVMTLFLFVIMLIGVDKTEDRADALRGQRSLGLLVSAGFAIVLLAVGSSAWITGAVSGAEPIGTAEAIADRLFNEWVLPFELTAILLIIAAVGTIALGFYKPAMREAMDAQPASAVSDDEEPQ